MLQDASELPPCIRHIGAEGAALACGSADCAASFRMPTCSRRKLAPSQHIFLQGDKQSHVYFVKSGAVRLYELLRSGRRQIVGFKFPGEFIALGYDAKHRFSAQAMKATELRSFASPAFHSAASNDPRFLLKLYEAVAKDLSRAYELTLSVGQRDAKGSVAAFLLNVEARAGKANGKSPILALPPRGDIADHLGLTLETISRIVMQLKRDGIIELHERGAARLVNHAALQAAADGVTQERRSL
ncbi:MAG TPA: cyclic nucleotide-binding domain-containing protein [Pseudolabrys sp.]|nr:cyclic nucleotide-binding domain-containing protein [Pseudolabrys sp.]